MCIICYAFALHTQHHGSGLNRVRSSARRSWYVGIGTAWTRRYIVQLAAVNMTTLEWMPASWSNGASATKIAIASRGRGRVVCEVLKESFEIIITLLQYYMQYQAFLVISCSNSGSADCLRSLWLPTSIRSQEEWKKACASQAIVVTLHHFYWCSM